MSNRHGAAGVERRAVNTRPWSLSLGSLASFASFGVHVALALVSFLVAAAGCATAATSTQSGSDSPASRKKGPPPYGAEALTGIVNLDEIAVSPDGKEVAFTSDASGAFELWTTALDDGGREKDGPPVKRQRTYLKEHVTSPSYSPDGAAIVFSCDHGGDERTDLYLLRRGQDAAERLTQTPTAEQAARFSPDGKSLAFESDPERPFRFNVAVMDLETRAVFSLTHEPINVLSPRWSRDGKTIAAVRTGDDSKGDLLLIDVAAAKAENSPATLKTAQTADPTHSEHAATPALLVTSPAATPAGAQRVIAAPRLSGGREGILRPIDFLPGGELLALATNEAGYLQLCTVDVGSGAVTLRGAGDWDVEMARVADDGTVAYVRNVRGRGEVTVESWLPSPSLAPAQVGAGAASPSVVEVSELSRSVSWMDEVVDDLAFSRDGRTLVAIHEAVNLPPSICARVAAVGEPPGCPIVVAAPEQKGPQKVDRARLGKVELRSFPSFDGRPIDAFLVKPPVLRLGSPPPLVIQVHGGPNSQARGAFNPLVQALSQAGFLVASPNYRGSSGYGRAFEDLNNKDWGGGDLEDLLSVAAALGASHEADLERAGIVGGSYGGYMVLRAITARPSVFRAAVDSYGMPDLVEDYRITADRFGSWYETEMGTPETDAALFADRSPIHALDRVRAPLLVLQGENDSNVPKVESDRLVSSLRERSARVDYVVYPDEGHGFTHREHRLDAIKRTVEFLTRELGQPAKKSN